MTYSGDLQPTAQRLKAKYFFADLQLASRFGNIPKMIIERPLENGFVYFTRRIPDWNTQFRDRRLVVQRLRQILRCNLVCPAHEYGPLNSVFKLADIAGPVNSGHVSGDPQQLACALLAMERGGAYLAAWIHSHPWRGAEATQPSSTDRHQYADLVRHYTEDLVGIIVVSDGHFRVFGDAVESGRIQLQLVGDGVKTVCEENHVYCLI